MDSCIPGVPLDNRLQKDRLRLVNKGSLSKRRKPSRYSCKPKIIQESSVGEYVTKIQIQNPVVPLNNTNKREIRRRSTSENRQKGSDRELTVNDSKKIAEIRKNAVLIQTWERRSQTDLKKTPELHQNGRINGTPNINPPKYPGKENRQSWKPVLTMPDALTTCGNDRAGLRNKYGSCNGNLNIPVLGKTSSVKSNRLIRPKSLCAINRSSSDEPEWISLSKKLCAKFVQSHLDVECLPSRNEPQQNVSRPVERKEPQHSIPKQKPKESSVKKTAVHQMTNGTSGTPPWIDLSRKLCTKFIEEHIETPPPDVNYVKPMQKVQSPHPRIVEKFVGRTNGDLQLKSKKDEPEWVNLSRRLRAKFIEGHKDDPDTISLDNQLNASDLEEYSDMKYQAKTHKELNHHSISEISKRNGNNNNVPKNSLPSANDASTISFCYWSDIDPCTKEIQESNLQKTTPSICTKTTFDTFENFNRSNIATDCFRYSSMFDQRQEDLIKEHSSTRKNSECPTKDYNKNYDNCYKSNISNGHNMSQKSISSVEDDVNYELTFETFETALEENVLNPKQEKDVANELNDISDRSVSKKTISKSLCDLSHCEPDSLECNYNTRDIDYGPSFSVHKESIPEKNGVIKSSVSVVNLHQPSSDFKVEREEALERSQSLIYVDSCCSPGIPQNGFYELEDNFQSDLVETSPQPTLKHSTESTENISSNCVNNNHHGIKPMLFSEFQPNGSSTLIKNKDLYSSEEVFYENIPNDKTIVNEFNNKGIEIDKNYNKPTKDKNHSNSNKHSGFQDPNCHRFFVSAVPETPLQHRIVNGESKNNNAKKKTKSRHDEVSLPNGKHKTVKQENSVKPDYGFPVERNTINSDKRELRRQKNSQKNNIESVHVQNGTSLHVNNGPPNKTKASIMEYNYFNDQQYRSIELTESYPAKNKTEYISEHINGKRESLKEFDDANESYQAINPPFEFDTFEIPSICSIENKRILNEEVDHYRDSSIGDYSDQKRLESSDSETPNSTPFDARTLVSPSSYTSESDTSSWTLAKTNSYGRNKTPVQDTDFSDCSMSVKCNDTPDCSNQSTLETRANTKSISEVPQKKNKSRDRFSEVFVECETTKDWKKTRSLDQLDTKGVSKDSNFYTNTNSQKELLNEKEFNGEKSSDKDDSTATMPESLRHLFNIPRNPIYTPTAKTSMLLSKSSEPPPSHYYANTPLSPTNNNNKKENTKSKTEKSSSVKIKDFAHGILLTFKKFQNQSKSSQLSPTQYVDVSHLAESNCNGRHKEFYPGSHPIRHGKDIQKLNPTEYGKINRVSAGYFGSRSTSESNLYRPSSSQLCTCNDHEIKSPKKVKKEERPKSFNFGMITDSKNKTKKKTPEMKEKKAKSSKSRGKKIETRSNSSVSRKVELMADGTLCLVTTVSGDTAVPGVYSDSQDTASEISSHAPVKLPGESNC